MSNIRRIHAKDMSEEFRIFGNVRRCVAIKICQEMLTNLAALFSFRGQVVGIICHEMLKNIRRCQERV